MTRKRKSGFLTFCFSFLPGAGEMYLGFMKMGISLMSLFCGVMAVSMLLNLGIIMLVDVVIWFYSFFHVHNLAGMPDEEFMNTKDDYLFNLDIFFKENKITEKYRDIIAIILIGVGGLLLWNGLKYAFMPWIPEFIFRVLSRFENTIMRVLLGIGIIIAGFRMIKGKSEELKEVIIDVDPKDLKEEGSYSWKAESNGRASAMETGETAGNGPQKGEEAKGQERGTDLMSSEERIVYGAETERKDS